MDRLPIDDLIPDVLAAVARHGAAVVVAPPGAGKTTRVPPALLDAGLARGGRVVMLQPRRVAARAAARRIAAERGSVPGEEVGYRVRFESCVGPNTRLEILTEGLLTRRLQSDPFLAGVGAVVLDELHERSLDADLCLALLAEVRREARPDLRLVAMSATLDPGPVAAFLGGCPVLTSVGRPYPVTVRHAPDPVHQAGRSERGLAERCAAAVRRQLEETSGGDVLVFLPGMAEITATAGALGDLPGVRVLPLHGALPSAAQDLALAPGPGRKVILATNVAETSITVPGVAAVVDSGLVRQSRFDPALGLARLEIVRVSRASADQRAGRAGRTGPGVCHRLYTEAEYRALAETDPPEVRRADLARTVLELHGWGVAPDRFGWFEAPPAAALDGARVLLERLGALHAGRLTPLGQQLLALPLHPRLARVVVAGHAAGYGRAAAAVASLASERDVFADPPDIVSDSDLALRLRALHRGRGEAGIDGRAVAQVRRVCDQIVEIAAAVLGPAGLGPSDPDAVPEAALVHALLAGFPDRVARRREPGSRRFVLATGAGARIDERSAVREAELVLAVTVEAAPRGERTEHRIRAAAALDPALLPRTRSTEVRFDAARETVLAVEVERYLELVLAERVRPLAEVSEAVARRLAEAVARDPRRALTLDDAATALVARLRFLAAHRPDLDLPTFPELETPGAPTALLEQLCAGRHAFAELRALPLAPVLTRALGPRHRADLDRLAPPGVSLPDGRVVRLAYGPEGPPVLAATIQRLFGLTRTPTVVEGRVPVVVHLLAPNGRPAQVTQDLASFWRTGYAEVRRQLRGRYPKHAWPEDPLAPVIDHRQRR